MPKRTYSPTADQGVTIAEARVNGELEWIFRKQNLADFGIDSHIEVLDSDHKPTGKLIGVQIKSGASYFEKKSDGGYVFRAKPEHVSYWKNHSLPVIVVLVNPKTDVCVWEAVTEKTLISTGRGWKILIPRDRELNAESADALEELTKGYLYSPKLVALTLAKRLMILAQEDDLWLEGNQWVNKLSGRSSLKFIRRDKFDDEDSVELEWPFILAPGWDFIDIVLDAFPWADFSVDEALYDHHDQIAWTEACGIFDGGECVGHYESFAEWSAKHLPRGLRGYTLQSGELALYRFLVELNVLGKAFLIVDEFVSKD